MHVVVNGSLLKADAVIDTGPQNGQVVTST